MKTEIPSFCADSLQALAPLPPALKAAAEDMERGSDAALLEAPLAALNDLRARLRSLTDKLGSQQAYLLIFGPLKSGKSTLMNAISGSYVSEVTSLPGYPCLVYVQHAEEPHFSVTRYNGRESVFANGVVLKDVIADSHIALADQIRVTEQRGEDFDPRTHFTEAIRRIDVKVPVQSLAESNTVLVDTPGLYSRMNFGYDVLTREFRDSAACAVFVVKTDNLFLEQVFAEFNQLLDLFSRIFLVINVDSSKRDLTPDGSLQPSDESRDPARIIEAFKTLSMAGPFRQAYEQKRVRIHAVDLLNAASAILSPNGSAPSGDQQRSAFQAFVADLTDYLNSSDYTVEFIRDSLRQGTTITGEARALLESPELADLRDRQDELAGEILGIDERIAATERLLKVDWQTAFEKVRSENTKRNEGGTRAKAAQLGKDLRSALDRWYEGSASLKSLEEQHWNPLLTGVGGSLAEDTRSRLRALLDTPLGGAEPAAATMTDLHTIGYQLGPIGRAAAAKLQEADVTTPYALSLADAEIPVRKSFADWILFRSQASVRRRLFGEDLSSDIPPEFKQKRLPDFSREALHTLLDAGVEQRFPALPTGFSESLLKSYVTDFSSRLLDGLRQQRDQFVAQRTARQTPFDANIRLLNALQSLGETAAKVSSDLQSVAIRHGAEPPITESDSLPVESAVESTELIAG